MPHRGPFRPLTERQIELVRLCGDGYTFAQIGAKLGIKPDTVQDHVTRIALLFDAYYEKQLSGAGWTPRRILESYAGYLKWESEMTEKLMAKLEAQAKD
jgi:hypothetical protein